MILEHLRTDHGGELDIVNLTGGEPTMHPQLFEMLEMAKAAGIHRVTVCTNGIRLAKDEAFVEQLAAHGARIALSFDTFDPHADKLMQGAHMLATKLRCMELCEKHDVDVTLIPVMTRGVNEHEIGKILDFALARPNVRHVEVHTMTFTGQSGATFQRSGRISMFEVLEEIERDDRRPAPPERLRDVAVRAPALLPDRLPPDRSRRRAADPVHALPARRGAARGAVGPALPRAVARASRSRSRGRSIGCGSEDDPTSPRARCASCATCSTRCSRRITR